MTCRRENEGQKELRVGRVGEVELGQARRASERACSPSLWEQQNPTQNRMRIWRLVVELDAAPSVSKCKGPLWDLGSGTQFMVACHTVARASQTWAAGITRDLAPPLARSDGAPQPQHSREVRRQNLFQPAQELYRAHRRPACPARPTRAVSDGVSLTRSARTMLRHTSSWTEKMSRTLFS